ncbi:pyridoxamine 5'-phosphate oxidase family protein [bacterium]|nr:pyridoxamine 5'-phosphate oxidase family protein [bacterium]
MSLDQKIYSDEKNINQILQRALVCRIVMADGDNPYIVPLCFGYENGCLYFHSSKSGKKNRILKQNPNVCFEVDIDAQVVKSEEACGWNMKYKSIIGSGRVIFIDNHKEKVKALDIITKHYSGKHLDIPEYKAATTCVFKIEIEDMTCKVN